MAHLIAKFTEHRILKVLGGALIWIVMEAIGWLPARTALTLLFFIVLDFALGFGLAVWRKEVDSGRMRRGVLKILLYWLLLLVINLLRQSLPGWEEFGRMLATVAIGYLICTEAISVLEKIAAVAAAAHIDLPVIGVILERLKAKRDPTM